MNIVVAGLWHLGSVTAACLSDAGFVVIGYDARTDIVNGLKQGHGPVSEPGLDHCIRKNLEKKTLTFTDEISACHAADIVWITFDTPVNDQDKADIIFVLEEVRCLYPYLKNNAIVLISSQLPVGSTRRIAAEYQKTYPDKNVSFAYSPENLRLGSALQIFTQPDRVVIGCDDPDAKVILTSLFQPFTDKIIWMSCVSAEMTKHAINAFLANSIVFANEIAQLCDAVGAKASEVEAGLKSESRIGPKAYLRAGAAFAGGTLARDVNYLIDLSKRTKVNTQLFPAIMASNEIHKQWTCQQLAQLWPDLNRKKISVLGLTYKPDTDTLVRSSAMELCVWLSSQGAQVQAYEPMLNVLPAQNDYQVTLRLSLADVLQEVDAIIITKRHEHFEQLGEALLKNTSPTLYVFDESGCYRDLAKCETLHYICLGGA